MRKGVALLLVLVFLTASLIMAAKPVSAATPVENSWTPRAPMHQARGGLGVAAVNGKIYAIGGTTSSRKPPDAFVGTNEEYDTITDTWTTKASMHTPRAYFAIAAYQNKIYCIGGVVGLGIVDERSQFRYYITSQVNEVYDTVTDSWVTKTPMPDVGMELQASVVNGKIYVMGGAFTYVYDPANDSWTSKKQMPVSHPVSVVVDNKIIVTGEFSTGLDSSEQKILIYDTETDSWDEGRSDPTVVNLGGAGATTGVKAPQRVYVLGLVVERYPPPSVNQVYDPKTDTWSTATAMPTNRSDFGVVVVNDILYAIGGYLRLSRGITLTAVNEQYTPIGYGTPPEIKIVSPVNQTYNGSSVSLVFTVNKQTSWLGYSLDGQDNVTITGNATLAGLTSGLHNITIYARDEFENMGASETITFSVEVPFPVAPVAAASAATVAMVGVGLLVYFKKRKH